MATMNDPTLPMGAPMQRPIDAGAPEQSTTPVMPPSQPMQSVTSARPEYRAFTADLASKASALNSARWIH